jgi:heme A synthase
MRPRFLYPALVLMVAALGALLALRLVPEPEHPAVWVAVLASIVVQGPLGWWVVRSVGTQRFLMVWGLGLLARLILIGLMAVLVGPAFGLSATPLLVTLAGLLAALLLVEGVVALAALPRT